MKQLLVILAFLLLAACNPKESFKIIREDTYDREYTAYEILRVEENTQYSAEIQKAPVRSILGKSHKIGGARFVIQVNKGNISGTHEGYISGGEFVDGKFRLEYKPTGRIEDEKLIQEISEALQNRKKEVVKEASDFEVGVRSIYNFNAD